MRFTLLLAALLAAPPSLAYAHGEARHAPAVAAAAEQTPWGIAGDPGEVTRTITLDMSDAMRFSSGDLTVDEGETVRLVVNNRGRMLHELVIGTPTALAEHAELMARFPGMEHGEPYIAHVAASQSGEIVWHFNRPGNFEFACLISGHYEAGMRGAITVLPRQP